MKKKKSLIAKFPLYFVIRFTHNHEINRQWITDKLGSYDGVDAYAKIVYFSTFYKLWAGAHKIEKGDRAPLLQLFRKLVYSDTEELFKKAVAEMKSTLSTKSIHPLKHTSSKMYSLERIVGHFCTGSMKG